MVYWMDTCAQGGLTVMAVGASLAAAHQLLQLALLYGKRKLLVTAEIDSRCAAASPQLRAAHLRGGKGGQVNSS